MKQGAHGALRDGLVCVAAIVVLGVLTAAQTGPPVDPVATRKADLVELVKLDPTIKLEIRYATTNNFTGKQVYPEARAFLQRPAALALVAAHRELARHGYGLLIHDGYRPWAITKVFWDVTPPALREFVADPATGSKHNRGCAVDLTLYDRKTGNAVEMPSGYDEMTPRAYPGLRGRPRRRARKTRPAANGHGTARLHRRAQRVVALQLQRLAGVSDTRHRVCCDPVKSTHTGKFKVTSSKFKVEILEHATPQSMRRRPDQLLCARRSQRSSTVRQDLHFEL